MFARGVVVEKFYPISYLTIEKVTKQNKTKQNKNKTKAKKTFFWKGWGVGRGSFLLSFLFLFSKKNFYSRKLIFHIPFFILKNIHNVDKSINQ